MQRVHDKNGDRRMKMSSWKQVLIDGYCVTRRAHLFKREMNSTHRDAATRVTISFDRDSKPRALYQAMTDENELFARDCVMTKLSLSGKYPQPKRPTVFDIPRLYDFPP
jgi:hypothetical protein